MLSAVTIHNEPDRQVHVAIVIEITSQNKCRNLPERCDHGTRLKCTVAIAREDFNLLALGPASLPDNPAA